MSTNLAMKPEPLLSSPNARLRTGQEGRSALAEILRSSGNHNNDSSDVASKVIPSRSLNSPPTSTISSFQPSNSSVSLSKDPNSPGASPAKPPGAQMPSHSRRRLSVTYLGLTGSSPPGPTPFLGPVRSRKRSGSACLSSPFSSTVIDDTTSEDGDPACSPTSASTNSSGYSPANPPLISCQRRMSLGAPMLRDALAAPNSVTSQSARSLGACSLGIQPTQGMSPKGFNIAEIIRLRAERGTGPGSGSGLSTSPTSSILPAAVGVGNHLPGRVSTSPLPSGQSQPFQALNPTQSLGNPFQSSMQALPLLSMPRPEVNASGPKLAERPRSANESTKPRVPDSMQERILKGDFHMM